jgi:hypothetical protein
LLYWYWRLTPAVCVAGSTRLLVLGSLVVDRSVGKPPLTSIGSLGSIHSVLLLLSESRGLPRSSFFFFAYTPALPSRRFVSSSGVNWLSYHTEGYISTVRSFCLLPVDGHLDAVGL